MFHLILEIDDLSSDNFLHSPKFLNTYTISSVQNYFIFFLYVKLHLNIERLIRTN